MPSLQSLPAISDDLRADQDTEAGIHQKLTKQNKKDCSEPLNDNKQTSSAGEEEAPATQEIIKFTRKNLRPVLQPFKRTDSVVEDGESSVERLLRQGDLGLRGKEGDSKISWYQAKIKDWILKEILFYV